MNTIQAIQEFHRLDEALPSRPVRYPLSDDDVETLEKVTGQLDPEGLMRQASGLCHLLWIATQSNEWDPLRQDFGDAFLVLEELCNLAAAADFAEGDAAYMLKEHEKAVIAKQGRAKS